MSVDADDLEHYPADCVPLSLRDAQRRAIPIQWCNLTEIASSLRSSQ
jgi:hypothetical protein